MNFINPTLGTWMLRAGAFGVCYDLWQAVATSKLSLTQTATHLIAGAAIGFIALQFGPTAAMGAFIAHSLAQPYIWLADNMNAYQFSITARVSAIIFGAVIGSLAR